MSGRKATTDIKPGQLALSVGKPNKPAPEGWHWIELNEVATMATGHTPSRSKPEYWGGNIPWISVRDARPYHGKTIYKTAENITPLGIKKSAAVLLPPGTVCLSRTGSIGYSIILGKEMATSQGFVNWICTEKLIPRFLQLLFVAENTFLHSISEGVAHTTIYFPETKAFHICLPTPEKQRAIVSKIEELFSELDKGIENLRLAQQQLKTYRQSVLKRAFEGRLTNENVKDGELPEGWELISLKEISRIVSGFAFKSSDFIDTGVPVIKISNISYSKFIWKEQQYLPKEFLTKNSDFIIQGGDLLVALTRPITNSTTKICKYPLNIPKGLLNQRVASIKDVKINESYLYIYLQTESFKEYIRTKFSETLQPNLSPKDLGLTPIPICSNEEQYKIVEAIESRLSVTDKMEECIRQSLANTEGLRQSILKSAFEGKLIN